MREYYISDGLSLHFTSLLILYDPFIPHYIPVMQTGVTDLMNYGFHCLEFAHTVFDYDLLVGVVIITLDSAFNICKADRNRRHRTHGIHKDSVIFHSSGKLRDVQLRKGLTLRLREVKDFCDLVPGDRYFYFFHDRRSVFVQNRFSGLRVKNFLLPFLLVRGRHDNRQSVLTLHHLAFKLLLPRGIRGDMCGGGHLHSDQEYVVGAVMMEFRHRIQNLLKLLICRHIFLQAGLQTVCDLLQLLPAGCSDLLKAAFLLTFRTDFADVSLCTFPL